jgi:hypothetical protein
VPPWADALDASDPLDTSAAGPDGPNQPPSSDLPVPLAPGARFRDARRSLGNFARSGDTDYLRRTLRHYVSSGYGGSGSGTMSRRLSGTARTAGRLNGLLLGGAGTSAAGDAIRDAVLRGGSDVGAVLDAIADAASPVDGTQDAETSRRSVRDSLTDLLEKYPDADLLGLSDAQRTFVIERFTTHDVFGRFLLDLQQAVVKAAGNPQTALSRLRQIREFIASEVSSAFQTVRDRGNPITTADVTRLTAQALRATMTVFEEYTE